MLGLLDELGKFLDSLSEEQRMLYSNPKEYYARWMGNGKIQIGRVVDTGEYDMRGNHIANLEDAVLVDKPNWVRDVSDFQLSDSEHYIKLYLTEYDKKGGATVEDAFKFKAEMNLVIGYNLLEERNLKGGK